MPDRPSRRLILLAAYEDFTRRESVCLGDENYDAMIALQEKKAKVITELGLLDGDFSAEEQQEFARRIPILQEKEQNNSELLTEKLKANRLEFRKLSQTSVSANKLRRAYAAPADRSVESGEFKGRA